LRFLTYWPNWTVFTVVAALVLSVAVFLSGTAAAESSNLTSTADTKLAENASTTNYGGATTIGVDGDEPTGSGKDAYSLLRWDLSSVPAGSRVDSVSVTLNVTNPSTQTYQAYDLKRAWEQSAATWLLYAPGSPWEVAGARGLLDRGAQVGSVSPSTMGKQTFTLSPALVQRWLDQPASNRGIVIANATNTDGFDFSSRESADASLRPSLSVNYSATTTPPPTGACNKGQFLAQYRNELRTFNTQPVLSRCEAAINYDWGGSPTSGVNSDSFTVRWVGTFDFEASGYEFTAATDDGMRLWVDGQLLIDQWKDQPNTTYKATKTMTAGAHEVKVEYYDSHSWGTAKVSWAKVTSSPPPSGTDPVMVGAGDIARCSSSGAEATAKLLDSIPGTVYTTGDNAYESGTASEFSNCYNPTWGRHKARTKPSVGNHEYRTTGASGYFDYFGAAAGDPSKGYYSYDLGKWRVYALNSMCEHVGGCGATSPMVTWLKQDLAANPKACTLAYFHHPLFSSGAHGSDPKMRPSWETLYSANADVILSGHDHHYERFAPQRPDGTADSARGIREFVAGMGGASQYGIGTVKPNSEVRNTDTYGVLKLTLHPTSYDWAFVPEAGKSFTDSGTTSCH
jgi:PA14 domain/Calcineurin-like phosphoesterase